LSKSECYFQNKSPESGDFIRTETPKHMTDQDDQSRMGAYAPPADDFNTFDARDDDARRGPLLLTAAILVFILFVGVVYSAYKQGLREGGPDGAPRVVADTEPYRERPLDPGGVPTQDTNLEVYDRLTGDTENVSDVSLRPAPEEIIDEARPSLRIETENDNSAGAANIDVPDVTPRQAPARPELEDIAPVTSDPQPSTIAEAIAQEVTPASTSAISARNINGDWVVQIASFRTIDDANDKWDAFNRIFSDISSGLAADIAQVEIADRGTYHRLRIAAFSTRDDATTFCNQLKARSQDCLVARR
jgi:cell division septation protein DedD